MNLQIVGTNKRIYDLVLTNVNLKTTLFFDIFAITQHNLNLIKLSTSTKMYKCLGTNILDSITQFHPSIYNLYILNKPTIMHRFSYPFLQLSFSYGTHPPHAIICSSINLQGRKMVKHHIRNHARIQGQSR